MFFEKFTSIPSNIISLIRDKLDKSGMYKEDIVVVDYQKGDHVSIKDGRFAEIDAILLSKKSKDRVRLLIYFLNRRVATEISKSDVGLKEVFKSFKF
tara:strand:- start:202 stop:492 length:291 start_codon:yes stop_codon:yes gene_type:complete